MVNCTTQVLVKPGTLRSQVLAALEDYFKQVEDDKPLSIHSLVLTEVESALYESVMHFTRGNQSKAARLLGVSRVTLRTKLKEYFRTTQVGVPVDVTGRVSGGA